MLLPEILTYIGIFILTYGLWSAFSGRHKTKELCFLSGTMTLALSASINYIFSGSLEVFAFVLLFLLQAAANLLEIFSKMGRVNTIIIASISIFLFSLFFLSGLLYKNYFFVISVGTMFAAFGYKEKPANLVRQNILLMMAAFFESAFAFLTNQYIYIVLNIPFIFFAVLKVSKARLGTN